MSTRIARTMHVKHLINNIFLTTTKFGEHSSDNICFNNSFSIVDYHQHFGIALRTYAYFYFICTQGTLCIHCLFFKLHELFPRFEFCLILCRISFKVARNCFSFYLKKRECTKRIAAAFEIKLSFLINLILIPLDGRLYSACATTIRRCAMILHANA